MNKPIFKYCAEDWICDVGTFIKRKQQTHPADRYFQKRSRKVKAYSISLSSILASL